MEISSSFCVQICRVCIEKEQFLSENKTAFFMLYNEVNSNTEGGRTG